MAKEYKMGKDIFWTAIKTALIVMGLAVVFSLCFFVINPYVSAKVCSAMGFKNLEASCYELIYLRTKSNEDCYNLVVKLGGVKKYAKQSKYIEILKNNTNYNDFCIAANQSVVDAYNNNTISAKTLSKLYGMNEYLASTYVDNYILLNNYDEAYNVVLSTKYNSGETFADGNFELAVYYYIDYLYSDAVSAIDCKNYCQKLAGIGEGDGNMIAYLTDKEGSNQSILDSAADGSYQKILALYAKVKITYSKYVLYKVTDQDEAAHEYYTKWQNAVAEYNSAVA